MICTSAAKLDVTAHANWQRLLPFQKKKITAFGYSATPQSTENILMETINPGKNTVETAAWKTTERLVLQFILKY